MLKKLQILTLALSLVTVFGTQVYAEDMGTNANNPYGNTAGTRDGYTNTAGYRDGYTNPADGRAGVRATRDGRDGARTRAVDDRPRRNWGWIGLLGLIGLAGARGNNKNPEPNRNQS